MKDDPRGLIVRMSEAMIRRLARAITKSLMLPFAKTDEHLVRYAMHRHLRAEFDSMPWEETVRALSISGSGYLAKLVCDRAEVIDASYPDHNMLDLQYEDASFDLVVSDQVLEHIAGNPFDAVRETYRVLKPGGVAVHTTCLLYQIHGYPSDYWRFTPDGLELICKDFSQIIDVGGWGNRYVWFLNWLGLIDGLTVPASAWHPYTYIASFNEWRYPVVTWVVARK